MKIFAAATLALSLLVAPAFAAEPDGLRLPPGFHASVVADGLTGMRHLAVRKNGDIYISTRTARAGASLIALRLDKTGKVVQTERFGDVAGGTGIRIFGNSLYATSVTGVYRFDFVGKDLIPVAAPQPVIDGVPSGGFQNRMIAFDDKGALYVAAGSAGNICTDPKAPKDAKPVGLTPCPGLTNRGGIWRFSASKLGQSFPADGAQVATGIRDMDALDFRRGDGLYAVMHGRNGTGATWPDLVSAADDDAVAEEMHRVAPGTNFGWPTTYYDGVRNVRLLAPEYGGDGKRASGAGVFSTPAVAFPGHSSPLDLVFYNGRQFPASYRGGAFVAFHGGNGEGGEAGRPGYNITFVPFAGSKPGQWTVFADGFAGATNASRSVKNAAYRPVGLAIAPDGSLYVGDSQKGRLWRIIYTGK